VGAFINEVIAPVIVVDPGWPDFEPATMLGEADLVAGVMRSWWPEAAHCAEIERSVPVGGPPGEG